LQAGGFFAQAFYVNNDGGSKDNPTFLYQTGNRTPVGRTQLEAQLQYNFQTPGLLNADWTAGFDYRFAGQDTEHLVYGRNEDDDDFSIVGGYLQGKFELASKLDLVMAGRYDRFNFIDDGAFAPRAALVFKAAPKHTVRASYNRATATVSNLQLNIDFPLSTIIPGSFDVWLYGNKTTQTFKNPRISWFNGLIPDVPVGTPGLPLGVPFALVNQQVVDGVSAVLSQDPNLAPLVPVIAGVLSGIDPTTLGTTGTLSPGFNIFDGSPLGLVDAPISTISTSDNYEIGYKGLIADKLSVAFDLYHVVEKNNSQFTAISPAYVLSGIENMPGDLSASVTATAMPQISAALLAAGLPQAQVDAIVAGLTPAIQGAYLQAGDAALNTPDPAFGGLSLLQVFNALPFHATSPTDQVPDNGVTHLAAGYRTFDERSYTGFDLGLEYYISDDISAFFNYSWVSDNEFMQHVVGFEDADPLPSYLNIPKNKFRTGLVYAPEMGLNGSISYQYDQSYYAGAGQFAGDTGDRNLVDLALGYNFDFGLNLSLAVTNALNNEYRYLPNMPKIGRRALVKAVYTFGAGE
ncbi:MAG: TonB-dependent receptor, partial [Bacteroidetes bacterium]